MLLFNNSKLLDGIQDRLLQQSVVFKSSSVVFLVMLTVQVDRTMHT